jgi:hypothetical protein
MLIVALVPGILFGMSTSRSAAPPAALPVQPPAHGTQRTVPAVAAQQAVVHRADDFSEQQHRQLEPHPAHAGYTHVGPNGAYHVGGTSTSGGGGYHYGSTSSYRGGGGYHYGSTSTSGGGGYHYGSTSSYRGGASYGGYHYGSYGGTSAGYAHTG